MNTLIIILVLLVLAVAVLGPSGYEISGWQILTAATFIAVAWLISLWAAFNLLLT